MKEILEKLFALADVKINGDKPWDIRVHDEKFYAEVLAGYSLALGESYMNGGWDCAALDQFFTKVFRAHLDKKIRREKFLLWHTLKARIINGGNAAAVQWGSIWPRALDSRKNAKKPMRLNFRMR